MTKNNSHVNTFVPNISYFLTKNSYRLPDEIAIVFEKKTWTWSEFDHRVSALAAVLIHEYAVVKGDRIIVQSPNNNQMLEIMMAVFRVGAIWVPANVRSGPKDILHIAETSGGKVMFVEAGLVAQADHCQAHINEVIVIGGKDDTYENLIARYYGTKVPDTVMDRDDPCWLFFTSGSTGKPKAAVLTHGQMTFAILNHLNDLMPGTGPQDASLVIAPISHGAGAHQMTQIAAGTKSVIMSSGKLDPSEAWELVEQWRISNMFTVPTIVKMLVEHPAAGMFDHSSLRYVVYAGAPMYREDQKRALNVMGNVLVQYYGLGEVTGAITVLAPNDHYDGDGKHYLDGSCGRERTGMQVQIQGKNGEVIPCREPGEICVIGQAVFPGYFNSNEANKKAFRNGWFRTGDLGYMDENGYLFITGRTSDMYISGGSNVYPREIEEVLLTHPCVSEAAVVGIPDPKWGEVGLAVCVARPGKKPKAQELIDFLSERVAKYKVPQKVVFWEEMPKTTVGKITKKIVLEELFAREIIINPKANIVAKEGI